MTDAGHDYIYHPKDVSDTGHPFPDAVPIGTKPAAATYKNQTLNEREKTHGDYAVTARIARALKLTVENCGDALSEVQRESLDLICTKMARILSGNPDEPDHWKDIAGYANLVSERLEK